MTYKQHKKIEAGDRGTTLVRAVLPAEFGTLFRRWQSVSDWAMGTASEGGNVELWIANECIDWEYYRESGEYRPIGVEQTRGAS